MYKVLVGLKSTVHEDCIGCTVTVQYNGQRAVMPQQAIKHYREGLKDYLDFGKVLCVLWNTGRLLFKYRLLSLLKVAPIPYIHVHTYHVLKSDI